MLSLLIISSDWVDPKLQIHEHDSYLYHKIIIWEGFTRVSSFFWYTRYSTKFILVITNMFWIVCSTRQWKKPIKVWCIFYILQFETFPPWICIQSNTTAIAICFAVCNIDSVVSVHYQSNSLAVECKFGIVVPKYFISSVIATMSLLYILLF